MVRKKGKGKVQELETESEEYGDSKEDALMELELRRLKESHGEAPPLWSTMPEFQNFTRAT